MQTGDHVHAEFLWEEHSDADDKKVRRLKLKNAKHIVAHRGGSITIRYEGDKTRENRGGVVVAPVTGVFEDQIVPFAEAAEGVWEAKLQVLNVDTHKETNPQFCKIDVEGIDEWCFPLAIYCYDDPSFAEAASPPKIVIKP